MKKLNRKSAKCQPPLQHTSTPFFNFSGSPPPGELFKIYSPNFKKKKGRVGGGELCTANDVDGAIVHVNSLDNNMIDLWYFLFLIMYFTYYVFMYLNITYWFISRLQYWQYNQIWKCYSVISDCFSWFVTT